MASLVAYSLITIIVMVIRLELMEPNRMLGPVEPSTELMTSKLIIISVIVITKPIITS